MKTAAAPFPFTSMFQNGPRRQGSAPQNRFKPGKDFPPPRTYRAPLPAPGRSEDSPDRRERGQMQSQNHSPFVADCGLPSVGIVETKSLLTPPRNPEIRGPPVDDVNNLSHHYRCQRCSLRWLFRSVGMLYSHHRNTHYAGIDAPEELLGTFNALLNRRISIRL